MASTDICPARVAHGLLGECLVAPAGNVNGDAGQEDGSDADRDSDLLEREAGRPGAPGCADHWKAIQNCLPSHLVCTP